MYKRQIQSQLAAFRVVYPQGARIGVIYSAPHVARLVKEAQKATEVLRIAVVGRAVPSEREVPQALRSLLQGSTAVDALWIPPDPVLLGEETRHHILTETLMAARPVYSFSAALVAEGALASNGPDFGSIGEHVGDLVNRIASGQGVAKSPMLVPRGELVINKKIAERLRIEIPPDALWAAQKILN